jgi:hypothetical protein
VTKVIITPNDFSPTLNFGTWKFGGEKRVIGEGGEENFSSANIWEQTDKIYVEK